MNDRRILIACLVILLIACLGLSCASIVGAGVYLFSTGSTEGPSIAEAYPTLEPNPSSPEKDPQSPPTDDSEIMETPTVPDDDPPPPPVEGEAIPPEIARQMDEIQMQVILDRGLKPTENVNRGLYSAEQLRAKVLQDFEEEYSPEEAQTDAQMLAAFGLLNPDFDLYTFYIDLLSEQIAGFFDQETKEMVVVQGKGFGGPERLTYAHEYTHALQDQNYDIENGLDYNDEACEADSERCAAIQALIEGDASLTELNWFFANATAQDQADIMEFYNSLEMPVYDSAPEFITLDFTFPYEYGYAFVEHLYDRGGWGTVDRAYDNLPISTEQILHPERYPDDVPTQVDLPEFAEILGSGWEEIDRGVMGEWYTYLILAKGLDTNAHLDEELAAQAAEGWGGDAYVVYHNPESEASTMVLHTTWDTSSDAIEYAEAFREYAVARFGSSSNDAWQGDDGYHVFYHAGDTTTWILAPDAATAQAIWQTLQP